MLNSSKINKNIENVKKHGWQIIDLRNCGLSEIPLEIFNYPELVSIDLSNDSFCSEESKNRIKAIPDSIKCLKNLFKLNISNNNVSEISNEIISLKKLSILNLSNNNLKEISSDIANMQSLKTLQIDNNPFEMLPPEITVRGIDAIRNFFKELDEKDYLYEVKLLLVGQGRVGKTSISEALLDEKYVLSDKESTEGINIDRLKIPQETISSINNKIKGDFFINIWDFGGQEIYHSTHQFFLTKRSIYLLVTESRKEDSHDDFYYWLNIIQLLGDNSPVVIVLNKCDQPTKDIPINEYKDVFNNIQGFHKISLKSGYEESFSEFKIALKEIATNLPHIGNPLPKVWVDIRNELETLKNSGRNYITEQEYFEICKRHYRDESSALFLSGYFHDLGVLLHFQDDFELKNTVFLNHEWLTTGVYKILDDREVINKKGKFDINDVKRIWSEETYKYKMYELILLMKNKKFDLCFEVGQNEYLIPRLLPVDEIDHKWEANVNNTKFEFRYKFMPKGILTRLIVKLNSDISKNQFWRYGVILQSENTRAIIKEKYFENKITIELSGEFKREYLFHIRKNIHEIHKDYNKIKVSEMIPCNCISCKSDFNPQFYNFDFLRRLEQSNIIETRCEKSLEIVIVSSLTNDIIRNNLKSDKIIACENLNASILNSLNFEHLIFYSEQDSASVFISVKTKKEMFGIRDRDFLTDLEIKNLTNLYKNYIILNYYCFENYLYHPDNIDELRLDGFSKENYINELRNQKNQKKNSIISNFKNSRKSYKELNPVLEKNIIDSNCENEIIKYLESDDLEIFFKSFSLKDNFSKNILEKYGLNDKLLSNTSWFKEKLEELFKPIYSSNSTI